MKSKLRKLFKFLNYLNPFHWIFVFLDNYELDLTQFIKSNRDRFATDFRGVPKTLDLPASLIDKIYKTYKEQGIEISYDGWWVIRDEYFANGFVYLNERRDNDKKQRQ